MTQIQLEHTSLILRIPKFFAKFASNNSSVKEGPTNLFGFKSHILRLSTLLVLAFSSHVLSAQTTIKNYDIKVAGITVGSFTATETKSKNGDVTYAVNSKVDINFWLYKMKTLFISEIKYLNGQMLSSRVDITSNKGDFYTETLKTSNGYMVKGVHQEGPFEHTITEPLHMNVAQLYFHEPKMETKVFAEFYGDFMIIKRLKDGVYHGVVKGNEDLFYYEKGILVKTVKKNGIKNLEFIYKDTVSKPSR